MLSIHLISLQSGRLTMLLDSAPEDRRHGVAPSPQSFSEEHPTQSFQELIPHTLKRYVPRPSGAEDLPLYSARTSSAKVVRILPMVARSMGF